MKVFKWAEEIEKVYEDLIEKAKKENLQELQDFREKQDENLEETMNKKEKIVNHTLKSLSNEIDDEIRLFQEKTSSAIQELISQYVGRKDEVIASIIKKLGFDFNG